MRRFLNEMGMAAGLMAGAMGGKADAAQPKHLDAGVSLEEHIQPGEKDFDEVDRKNADKMLELLGQIEGLTKPAIWFTYENLSKEDPTLVPGDLYLSPELEIKIIEAFVDHYLTPDQKVKNEKLKNLLRDRGTPTTHFKAYMVERSQLQKDIIVKHLVGSKVVLEQAIKEAVARHMREEQLRKNK